MATTITHTHTHAAYNYHDARNKVYTLLQGVTTDELDRVAHEFIVENGWSPSSATGILLALPTTARHAYWGFIGTWKDIEEICRDYMSLFPPNPKHQNHHKTLYSMVFEPQLLQA